MNFYICVSFYKLIRVLKNNVKSLKLRNVTDISKNYSRRDAATQAVDTGLKITRKVLNFVIETGKPEAYRYRPTIRHFLPRPRDEQRFSSHKNIADAIFTKS